MATAIIPAATALLRARSRDDGYSRATPRPWTSPGVRIRINGDALTLEADAGPPSAVLEFLVRHKAQVIELLRPGGDGWSGEDWRAFFDERAVIAEFDGGLPRDQAEARAFACCIAKRLNCNPLRPSPGAARSATAC